MTPPNPKLTPLDGALADALRAELPDAAWREPAPAYLEEPRGLWQGQAGAVVAPGSTDEVARIIRFAARHRVGVVPRAGGTGLVGGQVLPRGAPAPILLSLERMTAIRGTHPEENVLVAEAGCILAEVQQAAEAAGRLFPLSLASEGSARLGGLLATNAGGVNVLRWGNSRDLCLGIEAVLPDGTVLGGLKRLRKDNTGYDLRHLLIGAEGTLGIITAAALKLVPRPAVTGAALMVVESPSAALDLLAIAQAQGGVSAFELISGQGMRFLAEVGPEMRLPLEPIPEWCVLIDLGLEAGADAQGALERIFVEGAERGLVSDGVIAQSEAQRDAIWTMRESLPEANKRVGAVVSNDISLPLSALPDFLDRAGAAIARIGDFRINAFGHLGDGNLHYNVFPPPGGDRAALKPHVPALKEAVNELLAELGGSFSAEHGVGRAKLDEMARYGDPGKLAAMRAIKRALDPVGIMNPGAVLPPEG